MLALAHELRDRLVGLKHEFLDELFALAALAEADLDRLSGLIHADLRLRNIELERTALNAALVERVGEIVHLFCRFDEKGVFLAQTLVAREDLIDLVVRHARLGADDGFGEARAEAAAARVHLHERGEGETVDVRVERADAVGQRERQHGHDVTGKVDRGAAAERL